MNTQKTVYLFFDYDNTVRVGGEISDATIRAMTQARDRGHKLILCTGRARGSKIEDFEMIPWDAVINGGSDITVNGKCVEEKAVSDEELRAWTAFSMKNHLHFICEGQKEIIRHRFDEHQAQYTESEIARMLELVVAAHQENPVTKFSILGSNFDTIKLPKTRMNPIVHPQYLEVFGEGCDKGQAIIRFCELLGVSIEQCACFGDSMNDYAMFEVCPVSVCMEWAPKRLAEIATYKAQTDEGVAEGLAWLFQEEQQ